jgi:hypothetical protein
VGRYVGPVEALDEPCAGTDDMAIVAATRQFGRNLDGVVDRSAAALRDDLDDSHISRRPADD